MERPLVDHLTSQNFVSTTSLTSLAQGYILNCRCEGKSPSTVGTYEEHLRRFLAYCQQKGIPDQPAKLGTHHLREFLWYVASEPVRWSGRPTTTRTDEERLSIRLGKQVPICSLEQRIYNDFQGLRRPCGRRPP